jgi:hypothetical protein
MYDVMHFNQWIPNSLVHKESKKLLFKSDALVMFISHKRVNFFRYKHLKERRHHKFSPVLVKISIKLDRGIEIWDVEQNLGWNVRQDRTQCS